ncbi:hypothetical protein KAJ83_09620 [Marivibrio halodurans]|uniref:Uncharacterized protein n=1 Tax=Marivibrio halodurans TaxID=2039722 RepID=A0A8J7V0Y9_9PROT|nr:hypothetical protein [Marivibrio halodurans]MBP5857266.1 hypothetical protein [Marivibrio halodurans]
MDEAHAIRTLHDGGFDPAEICCLLICEWQTVERALFVSLETNSVASPDPDPVGQEALSPPTPPQPEIKHRAPADAGPTPAAERTAEVEAIERHIRDKGASRSVNFGADAPAVEYLRACGIEVYGAPPALRQRGRWMVNGIVASTAALWERARKEADRRGDQAPRKGRTGARS